MVTIQFFSRVSTHPLFSNNYFHLLPNHYFPRVTVYISQSTAGDEALWDGNRRGLQRHHSWWWHCWASCLTIWGAHLRIDIFRRHRPIESRCHIVLARRTSTCWWFTSGWTNDGKGTKLTYMNVNVIPLDLTPFLVIVFHGHFS